jgi:hypothetical protein
MALTNEFPVISSELGQGLGLFGSMTPFNAALQNNGALNPLGALYFVPSPSEGGALNAGGGFLPSKTGFASGLWVKYCLYKSTANPAAVTGPAPVYFTDETFTTVSGQFSEGVQASKSISAAGWLLPNAGTVSGVGAGATLFTATLLNNGGLGSYVWVGIQGFIPSAYLAAGAASNWVYGSGNFATTGVVADGASTYNDFKNIGVVIGSVTSNIGDVLATGWLF